MFKVICISTTVFPSRYPIAIKEGEIYTVIDVQVHRDGVYYALNVDWEHIYASEAFIRLSDISETDFIREYNKEKV